MLIVLCEIQWVIKLHFSTEKGNHVDKVALFIFVLSHYPLYVT